MSSDRAARPKYNLTCYFWAHSSGGCRNSDEECQYQHAHTGRIAFPRSQRHQHEYTETAVPSPRIENEEITCYYWHQNGSCRLSDGDCRYAHWHTGRVALPPGSIHRASTGEQWHANNVALAPSGFPRLSMNERLARHQLVNDIDEQIHLAREGKFQANKNLNPFILKIGPVPTVASARSGFDRTADPDYSRPSQPYQQRFSTYSPREISSTPYPTSQTHQAIVRAPQSISMSYDPNASRAYADRPGPDDLRASGHRPGPQRTRRGHYLASEEAYRRTFREESRNHRSTPYVIPRPRTPRRTNFFDEVDINGVPIDETTERGPTPATRAHLPARTTNGTMEAERFLRQSDLIYSSSGPGRRFVSVVPAYGRQAATSIFSTPSRHSTS